MATKAWIAKQKRREALVKKFADIRRQLKKEKNFAALPGSRAIPAQRARTTVANCPAAPAARCENSKSRASCSGSWHWPAKFRG